MNIICKKCVISSEIVETQLKKRKGVKINERTHTHTHKTF